MWGRGKGCRGRCQWAPGPTHVRSKARISARRCLATAAAMARNCCRSMAQRRTGLSAAARGGQRGAEGLVGGDTGGLWVPSPCTVAVRLQW